MNAFKNATPMRIPPRYVFAKLSYSRDAYVSTCKYRCHCRVTLKSMPRRTYSRMPAMINRMLNIVIKQSKY